MPSVRSSLLSLTVGLAACIASGKVVEAQQPKLEMHRVGVSADDGSGWHLAVSSKGSFSISLPIPFNDFTTQSATGEVSHVVGAKSAEGVKFSAAELPVTAATPRDLAAIPKTFSANAGNKVSDLSHSKKDGTETLSFSVSNAASTAHMRYIKTPAALYTLIIEYPQAQREIGLASKDKFFASFKLKAKS